QRVTGADPSLHLLAEKRRYDPRVGKNRLTWIRGSESLFQEQDCRLQVLKKSRLHVRAVVGSLLEELLIVDPDVNPGLVAELGLNFVDVFHEAGRRIEQALRLSSRFSERFDCAVDLAFRIDLLRGLEEHGWAAVILLDVGLDKAVSPAIL